MMQTGVSLALASMYDASLDAIKPHDWSNLYFPNNNHDILIITSRLAHALHLMALTLLFHCLNIPTKITVVKTVHFLSLIRLIILDFILIIIQTDILSE